MLYLKKQYFAPRVTHIELRRRLIERSNAVCIPAMVCVVAIPFQIGLTLNGISLERFSYLWMLLLGFTIAIMAWLLAQVWRLVNDWEKYRDETRGR